MRQPYTDTCVFYQERRTLTSGGDTGISINLPQTTAGIDDLRDLSIFAYNTTANRGRIFIALQTKGGSNFVISMLANEIPSGPEINASVHYDKSGIFVPHGIETRIRFLFYDCTTSDVINFGYSYTHRRYSR